MAILSRRSFVAGFFAFLGLGSIGAGRALATKSLRTDLNLVMAIDCSYSVSSAEFELQVQGIAYALKSAAVAQAIAEGPEQQIALSIIQWSGPDSQVVVVPWSIIASAEDAAMVADQLLQQPRLTAEGVTAIGSAILFCAQHLARAPYFAERQVIDMQADGTSTWARGVPITKARDDAVARGYVINGLPILNEVPFLHHYFEDQVIGGAGSFIEIAENYGAFEIAIKRKLVREIRGYSVS